MPTVFRWKNYRFFWYRADGSEPPHVHIFKDGKECKFWLRDMKLAFNRGHSEIDLRALAEVTAAQRDYFLEMWNEHFGN